MSESHILDHNFSIVKEADSNYRGKNNEAKYCKSTDELLSKHFEDKDFQNPLCLPLELITFPVENSDTSVPAISVHWITNWCYGEFHENIKEDDLKKLSEGFKWLLNLNLHTFWSQIIYEQSTITAVKSFIIKKRYKHDNVIKDHNNCDYNKLYNEIYWSVYRILQRIVHSRISKNQYLYSLFHQYVLQKYDLFSEEIIMSICGLYGNKYPHSIQILLEKIFIANKTLSTIGIKEIAKNTEEKFNLIHSFHIKQWFTYILNSKKDNSSPLTVYNVTLSLLHCIEEFFNERRVFVQLYPSSIQWFRYYGIEKLLSWFFEEDIGYISNILNKMNIDEVHINKVHHQYIWKKMINTCEEIVKMFRLFLLDLIYCAEINNRRKKSSNFNNFSVKYLELLSDLLQHPRFAKCYMRDYNIMNDVKITKEVFKNVNIASVKLLENEIEEFFKKNNVTQRATNNLSHETENEFFKLHYELQSNPAFKNQFKNKVVSLDAFKLMVKMNSIKISSENEEGFKTVEDMVSENKTISNEFIPNEFDYKSNMNEDEAYNAAIAESLRSVNNGFVENDVNVMFDSLIVEVKSILPHLGEGFISECLKYYNNNTQEVISAILEENLPPQLMSCDQSSPLIPEDPIEILAEKKGHDRRNVYDGDEFDKMTKETFDPKRVFRKKNKYDFKDVKAMLDDKSHVREQTERYTTYSCDMYDDDYDDFENNYQVVLGGDLTADEVEDRFSCNWRIKPLNKNLQSASSSSDSEIDDSNNSEAKSFNAFCENPAVLREQAEARRAQKYQNKQRGNNKNNQVPNRDVVGAPKGQGQDKTVVQNRSFKNTKKSSLANHNRRAGAQWKRNKGMLPS